jgi:general secretion pathway protein G
MKVNLQFNLRRKRRSSAFTLIEMVLVLAIIALLVGAGVMKLTNVLDSGKEGAVQTDIAAVTSALRLYAIKAKRMPTTEQGLMALVQRPTIAPLPKNWSPKLNSADDLLDPWGNNYAYRWPGLDGREFDLWSFGPDRVDGTEDDIGNW